MLFRLFVVPLVSRAIGQPPAITGNYTYLYSHPFFACLHAIPIHPFIALLSILLLASSCSFLHSSPFSLSRLNPSFNTSFICRQPRLRSYPNPHSNILTHSLFPFIFLQTTYRNSERPLHEIKKKGRPSTQCPHCKELRKAKQVSVRCICGREEGN